MALLDLKSEGHRETVIIDGTEYALAPFEGFSITDQHKMRQDGQRITKLAGQKEQTAESAAEIEAITEGWFELFAGDIPQDVRKKLLPGSKQEVVKAYFLELGLVLAAQNPQADRSKTGLVKGSRRSAGSTKGSRSKSG